MDRGVNPQSSSCEVGQTAHRHESKGTAPHRTGLIKLDPARHQHHPEDQQDDRQAKSSDSQSVRQTSRDLATNRSQRVNVGQADEESDHEKGHDREVALVALPEVGFGHFLRACARCRLFYRRFLVPRWCHNHLTY